MNRRIAGGFGVVLILTGIGGFVLPPGLMSNAAPYNLFHIAFGVLGVLLFATRSVAAARSFNIGFGAIDLYQAVAHWLGIFPISFFQWKTADDVLHVLIGAALVAVGVWFKG